jgi:hypothetical protein
MALHPLEEDKYIDRFESGLKYGAKENISN